MHALLAVFGVIFTMVVSVVWSGYALSILWGWFIAPTFNAPVLSIPSAIGVAMVVSYLTHQHKVKNSGDSDGWQAVGEAVVFAVVRPAFALLIGLIVKQWM